MLAERYNIDFLQQTMVPTAQWFPFPPARERASWDALLGGQPLNLARREALVQEAEALLGQPCPALPATMYMEFARNGNRDRYESPYFLRRARLSTLVLAEAMTHTGRYLDEVINYLWAIREEASWCLPAHAERLPNDVLPREDRPSVDLFACETAGVLAEACYLLREELSAVSPSLLRAVDTEILRRVIVPVEEREDLWWLGGRNNWTPWCSASTLCAACYSLDDPARMAALTRKLMIAVDRFLGNYGADGGCDEGPGYWGVAAGALLLFLELLHSRTGGAIDIYQEPLIRNMGRFIAKVHLDGPWFVNFADAAARIEFLRAIVFIASGSGSVTLEMPNMALLNMREWQVGHPVSSLFPPSHTGADLLYRLRELWWMPAAEEPVEMPRATAHWLPDVQVLVARETPCSDRGLTLAAKGGHNDENHNHNDIGQFIIMCDGQPGIIDIGVETYTKDTFGPGRYGLWCIRSAGHNVPLVNGIEQAAGHAHHATDVSFSDDVTVARLAMCLEEAYPAEAGLTALRREITFARPAACITVQDTLRVSAAFLRVTLPLYAVQPVTEITPGCLAIACAPRRLLMQFDPRVWQAEIATVDITDPTLQSSWGTTLTRMTLQAVGDGDELSYTLIFRPE